MMRAAPIRAALLRGVIIRAAMMHAAINGGAGTPFRNHYCTKNKGER